MVKQLRRKLVGAYVLATGLLLSLIVTGLLLLSLNQYETNNISRYQTVFGNVVDTIRDSNKISHMWLAQSEISENMMISVSSNSESAFWNSENRFPALCIVLLPVTYM